jgi:hypothetical protein
LEAGIFKNKETLKVNFKEAGYVFGFALIARTC